MEFNLGYGKEKQMIHVPDANVAAVLCPNDVKKEKTGEEEVRRALEHPIGSKKLRDIVKAGEKICVITSDQTRPMPSKTVLPVLLEELYCARIRDEDITVVFALGNHRAHTEAEKRALVGDDIFDRIRCVDSDQKKTVHVGETSLGTPVDIFEEVVQADRVICLGNIEYHYFAGYSGGAKAIMPGVSTAMAIQANHSRMVERTSCTGNLAGNRVRLDIEEAADMVGVDFILNVVLDEHKQVIRAVAGDLTMAHREGCAFLDKLYKVDIEEKADIVVVSPGGYPKDINQYQAQEALDNAKHAVKDGGIIVLVASCKEGLGEKVFSRWMMEAPNPESMIEKIQIKFELGGHKAAAIGMVQQMASIYLVSDLADEDARSMFFEPFGDAQQAVDAALKQKGSDAKVIVMPFGGSILPRLA